jgi:hypothetical protein
MQHSPFWEPEIPLVFHEVPHLLQNPKIHRRIFNSPSLFPVQNHMNLVYILTLYFFKTDSNIAFPLMPASLQ